ncbi:MAG: septum formation protein Maf [Muribaculaceae bacterium]|nr:septum formation protein Maf [Muribaculaceae bacterium]
MTVLENLRKYDVVLASHSPRRRELFGALGIDFRVEVIRGIDETPPPDLPRHAIAEYLSRQKAAAYDISPNELLITADTVVILGDEVMGKPADAAQARSMLRQLSGRTHSVVTGVTVTTADTVHSFSDEALVTFDTLSDQEIVHYVKQYKPYDKAGAYGIQEWIGYIGVKSIHGSFFTVMGLPVQRLYQLLKTL